MKIAAANESRFSDCRGTFRSEHRAKGTTGRGGVSPRGFEEERTPRCGITARHWRGWETPADAVPTTPCLLSLPLLLSIFVGRFD